MMTRATGIERMAALFDRIAGLPHDPSTRADLLHTAMLRPLGLAMASAGFMVMSGTAFALTRSDWALAWLTLDVTMLLARMIPAIRARHTGARVPERVARLILTAAFVMFATFTLGCAASFRTGIVTLQIASLVALMGLVAGLATRWAAIPRLAMILIGAGAIPMAVTIASVSPLGAVQFVLVTVSTAVLTLQNHRTLIAMLRAEREARRLAGTDALTGLLNRAGLRDAINRLCVAADATDPVAMLYLDLDGFKVINDRYGHGAGDRVLATIGRRLRRIAGAHLTARIGGDEFVLVLTAPAAGAPEAFAVRVRDHVGRPIALAEGETETLVRVGVSVGIATGLLASDDPDALLADADAALYAAKPARATPRRDAA